MTAKLKCTVLRRVVTGNGHGFSDTNIHRVFVELSRKEYDDFKRQQADEKLDD